MKRVLVGILVGTSIFALSGCGSNKAADIASRYEAALEEAAFDEASYYDSGDFAYEEAASAEMSANAGGGEVNAETVGESATSRKLIATVTVEAQATDFEESAAKVKDKVAQLGGYIEYESCGENYGEYTIRIPSKNLDAFLEKVEEYSNVTYHSTSVEDVTLTYVDIEARISALRVEQKRLEEFLAAAETVEDMITIEDRLTNVRYELQSYESQKRTYDNKIDYSTVHLNLRAVSTYTAPSKGTIGERIKYGLKENFMEFGEKMGDFLVAVATTLPIIITLLIPIGIIFCVIFFPVNAAVKKREAKRKAENEAKKAE